MASPRQNSGLAAHTESIRIITHVCRLGFVNVSECLCVLEKCLKQCVTKCAHTRYMRVCVLHVCQQASSACSRAVAVPREALMTQGVEGGWVVAEEVWLATGHHGSSQAQSRCTHGGNSLGRAWALGLGRLWSTPLIRLQIASQGYAGGPGPCGERSEWFLKEGQSWKERVIKRQRKVERKRKLTRPPAKC